MSAHPAEPIRVKGQDWWSKNYLFFYAQQNMNPSTLVIGISGATCSGKTTLAKNLARILGKTANVDTLYLNQVSQITCLSREYIILKVKLFLLNWRLDSRPAWFLKKICLTFFWLLLTNSEVETPQKWPWNFFYPGCQDFEIPRLSPGSPQSWNFKVLATWVKKIPGSFLGCFYFRIGE